MTAVNPAVLSTPGAETSKVMLVKLTADANPQRSWVTSARRSTVPA